MVATLIAALALQAPNTLTDAEKKAGWILLFDGKTTAGWNNYKSPGVGKGWKIEDGILTSVDPGTAGDIVTEQKFDWFELTLEFRNTPGGNSGIMIRVGEDGETAWQTGPEIQIYDHKPQDGVETTGYLYQLYKPSFDAAKPAGEWNQLRIVVDPKLCFTELNGKRYYEYVYGSEDFWDRVKKSKFSKYPKFGKIEKGAIGIQGDHGVVSFRNIKIRPIKP